jgi:phytoene dehydrogenase-like protein
VHGSVIVGLRRTAKATRGVAGARYGLFVAHKDGMGALVDALAARLPAGAVRLGARVDRLERRPAAGASHRRCGGRRRRGRARVLRPTPAPSCWHLSTACSPATLAASRTPRPRS